MSTQAILERERRYRRLVVVASILPLLLLVGAAAFQSSGGGTSELATATLRTINENAGSQLIGSIIAAFAFLLLAAPLAYIYKAAQARSERVLERTPLPGRPRPGPLRGPGRPARRRPDPGRGPVRRPGEPASATSTRSRRTCSRTRAPAPPPSTSIRSRRSAIIFGMVYTCLWGVRTGLLTRFHGTLGMALGATFILPPLIGPDAARPARVVHVLRPAYRRPDAEGQPPGLGRRRRDPAAQGGRGAGAGRRGGRRTT